MFLTLVAAAQIILPNSAESLTFPQMRLKTSLNHAVELCFYDHQLEPGILYTIWTEYLGSIGVDFAMFWKTDEEQMISKINNYIPLDTVKLDLKLDSIENKQICFYTVPYQISVSVHKDPYPEGIEFFISIDRHNLGIRQDVSFGIDQSQLMHYIFTAVVPGIITFIIYIVERMWKTKIS